MQSLPMIIIKNVFKIDFVFVFKWSVFEEKKIAIFFQVRKEKTTTNCTCESIILFQVAAAVVVVFSVIFKNHMNAAHTNTTYSILNKIKTQKKIHETN